MMKTKSDFKPIYTSEIKRVRKKSGLTQKIMGKFIFIISVIDELPLLADLRWALCSDDDETEQSVDKVHFREQFIESIRKLDAIGNLINFVAEKNAELIGSFL